MRKWIPWMIGLVLASFLGSAALAEQISEPANSSDKAAIYKTIGLGAAAAFAVGISILGAAHAVGKIGSAALGAAAEKPELLTRSIVFVALAEGLGVLGFAIAMMLLQKIQ